VANGRKKGNNSKPPLDISPYNYCVQTSDCVVITGSLSGFQSGVVTNKNEAEILSQIINPQCPPNHVSGIEESANFPGHKLTSACVNRQCRCVVSNQPGGTPWEIAVQEPTAFFREFLLKFIGLPQ
jgi:hypothetical protein